VWINLAKVRHKWWAFVNTVMNFRVPVVERLQDELCFMQLNALRRANQFLRR
jgi:hypothetical protein